MIRATHIIKHAWEGIAFLLLVIILFNTLTDFVIKVGLISHTITVSQIQGFGAMATFIALANVLSREFFGVVSIN